MPKHQLDWKASAPEGGWIERTYYVAWVQFSSSNPRHKAIFYSGFLNNPGRLPGGYACVFNATYEDIQQITSLYSIEIICSIPEMSRE